MRLPRGESEERVPPRVPTAIHVFLIASDSTTSHRFIDTVTIADEISSRRGWFVNLETRFCQELLDPERKYLYKWLISRER